MEELTYLPIKRTAVEEGKWLKMQELIEKIKLEMGDKWLLAKTVEKDNESI